MEAGKFVGAAATIPLGISAGIIGSTLGAFWGMRERGWLSGLNDED